MENKAIRGTMLADQIRDYLAMWTAREHPGSFIVITSVTLSGNLHKATVWVRFPKGNIELFSKLQRSSKHYQHLLTTTLSRFKIPTIIFAIDTRPDIDAEL